MNTQFLLFLSISLHIVSATWWRPQVGSRFQIQFDDDIDTNVNADVFDLDSEADQSTINILKAKGKKLICYVSVGSWESYRSDAARFPQRVLGKGYVGFPHEKWLDIRQISILIPIMSARMDVCKQKGFDAIQPDNLMDSGFTITYAQNLQYAKLLSQLAHSKNLAIGIDNCPEMVNDLLNDVDFGLVESGFRFDEATPFIPLINAGKPVFAIEYTDAGSTLASFCPQAIQMKFSAILKHQQMDAWVQFCPDTNTPPQTATWWRPQVGSRFQIQFDGDIDTNVNADVFDLDSEVDQSSINILKAKGKKLICYVDVGSWESYRPDAARFPQRVLGKGYPGFPDERWLDIRQTSILIPIMSARMDVCKQKGFDAIQPDNLMVYTQDSGFTITYAQNLQYAKLLSQLAHSKNLAIEMVNDLLNDVDFGLVESGFRFNEATQFIPLINAGKPVFAIEYTDAGSTLASFCPQAKQMKFSAILKHQQLNSWVQFCP